MRAVHRLVMDVRWRDLDAFGHVNNAAYHGYVEECRVRWFRSMTSDWAGATSAPILAAVEMNYRRPMGWPESIVVEMSALRIGTKSVTLAHRIVSATDADLLYADGHAVLVWVDGAGATLPLPAAVRSACEG